MVTTDNKTYLNVACSGGYISIKELQLQGKENDYRRILRGYKFPENTTFL
ncbi:MAG: hypothetical protein IPJ32_00345 [Sphingobacteriaceae bacterium]|nr:hypothetical protein [Sphingobacteriaceae bacterium]